MLQICCKITIIPKEFPIGSSLLDIYYGFNLNFPYQVVSAKVNNNRLRDLISEYIIIKGRRISGRKRFLRNAYVCAFTLFCLV